MFPYRAMMENTSRTIDLRATDHKVFPVLGLNAHCPISVIFS